MGNHFIIGHVENSVDIIVPNVHGVQSSLEPQLINWRTLTWVNMDRF
jgi:hypothetical protein